MKIFLDKLKFKGKEMTKFYFLMSEMTLDKMYYTTHESSYNDENGKYVSISNYFHSDIYKIILPRRYKKSFSWQNFT